MQEIEFIDYSGPYTGTHEGYYSRRWQYARFGGIDERVQTFSNDTFTKPSERAQISEQIVNNPQISALTMNMLEPFIDPTTLNGHIREHVRAGGLKVFTDGDRDHSPFTQAPATFNGKGDKYVDPFVVSTQRAVASTYAHYFNAETGEFATPEAAEAFERAKELAPQLMDAITHKDNYIASVQSHHATSLIEAALQMASDPKKSVAIRTGFGGSDDDETSVRFASYAIPGLKMARRINQVMEQNGVEHAKPTVQFVFADEIAIGIETKDPGKTRERTRRNMEILKAFAQTHFPDVEEQIQFVADTPWDEHTPLTSEYLNYMAYILSQKRKEDPRLDNTLRIVERMGHNQGEANGRNNALKYSGTHPLVFGELTFGNYLEEKDPTSGKQVMQKPGVMVTVGGPPEGHFCYIRKVNAQEASNSGFADYLDQQGEVDPTRKGYFSELAEQALRATPSQKPTMVPLLTTVGNQPVYYKRVWDSATSSSPNLETIEQERIAIGARIAQLKQQNGSFPKSGVEIVRMQGALVDLAALQETVKYSSINKAGTLQEGQQIAVS